jgi:hypothetical protein
MQWQYPSNAWQQVPSGSASKTASPGDTVLLNSRCGTCVTIAALLRDRFGLTGASL